MNTNIAILNRQTTKCCSPYNYKNAENQNFEKSQHSAK